MPNIWDHLSQFSEYWRPCTVKRFYEDGKETQKVTFKLDDGILMYFRRYRIDLLVLDEISMISGEMLDHVDHTLRTILGKDKPFGGIQLVFLGDFCQLPPIEESKSKNPYATFLNRGFAFQSRFWERAEFNVVTLDKNHRQPEVEFYNILNKIRLGEKLNKEELSFINEAHNRPLDKPTQLLSISNDFYIELARNDQIKKLHSH